MHRFFISFAVATAVVFLPSMSAPAQSLAEKSLPDPLTLYGPVATYDILRDGARVGEHRISFTQQGNDLRVASQSDIEIPFLFLTAYAFTYRAETIWRNGLLEGLTATTDDDGTKSTIRAEARQNVLRLQGPSGEIAIDPSLPISEHWSRAFIDGSSQLNTITGAVNRIETRDLGDAFVPLATGTARADRYRIDGDIQLETWYDHSGRWLGMRFLAKDKSTIEYRCRSCQADMAYRP